MTNDFDPFCRLGIIDNETVVNPTRRELQSSSLDLILTATKHNLVVMLEGKANIVPYQSVSKSLRIGVKYCQKIISEIENLQKSFGKEKRTVDEPEPMEQEIIEALKSLCEMRINEIFRNHTHDKMSRDQAIQSVRQDAVNRIWSSYPSLDPALIGDEFNKISKDIFRELIFTEIRCDGRELTDLRNISCEVDLYEPLHGSAIFQRGQTQVMATVALDSVDSALKLDSLAALDT